MKLIFSTAILFLLLSNHSLFSQSFWQNVSPKNVHNHFQSGTFYSQEQGYVVGWAYAEGGSVSSTIARTADGGKSWLTEDFPDIELNSISFRDEKNGIVVGRSLDCNCPIILSTTDGGEDWSESKVSDLQGGFNAVDFADQMNGVIGGGDPDAARGYLLRTVDGGKTFTKVMDEGGRYISRLDLVTSKLLFIVTGEFAGVEKSIFRSQNVDADSAQVAFTEVKDFGETSLINSINFVNELYGITVLTFFDEETFEFRADIFRTVDGGENWNQFFTTPDFTLITADFLDADHGVAVGSDGTIVMTDDGGASWKDTTTFATSLLTWCEYASPTTIYAAGTSGTVMKYQSSLVSVTTGPDVVKGRFVEVIGSVGGGAVLIVVDEGRDHLIGSTLEVVNVRGSLVAEETISAPRVGIEFRDFTPGLYFYRLVHKGSLLGSGHFMVR
ncbi:MAG: WD40/YVTN/BNR-like repeat-containing protein [Candidatus Kapaibacterium sp.]